MLKRIKNLLHIKTKEAELTSGEKIDNLFDSLNEDIILLHLGEDLADFGQLFCSIIQELREEIKFECGFIIPEVHVLDWEFLQENEFRLYIKNKQIEHGFLIPNEKGIREEFYEILKTSLYENIDKIFTNEIAEKYIDTVQRKNGWLIWNITNILSIVDLKTIMLDIIQKGKSLNNINYIFEQIGNQILTEGKYRDCLIKHNPHVIAKEIVEQL